jgi:hypothetical protein
MSIEPGIPFQLDEYYLQERKAGAQASGKKVSPVRHE